MKNTLRQEGRERGKGKRAGQEGRQICKQTTEVQGSENKETEKKASTELKKLSGIVEER